MQYSRNCVYHPEVDGRRSDAFNKNERVKEILLLNRARRPDIIMVTDLKWKRPLVQGNVVALYTWSVARAESLP
jgi:hypothetical protein